MVESLLDQVLVKDMMVLLRWEAGHQQCKFAVDHNPRSEVVVGYTEGILVLRTLDDHTAGPQNVP